MISHQNNNNNDDVDHAVANANRSNVITSIASLFSDNRGPDEPMSGMLDNVNDNGECIN